MEIASGRRWIVSSDSGFFPHWSEDGKTILFSSSNSQVNAVAVETVPTFSASEAVRTFEIDAERQAQSLDVDRDASRLLVGMTVEGDNEVENRPRVTVVMNWFETLADRVKAQGAGQ